MDSADELCFIKEKYLRCPICVKLPPSEVFQCKNGHMLCHQCILNVGETCPQCQVPFGDNKIRVLALENILNQVVFNCPSKKLGCVQTMKRSELKVHSKICEFRAVNICPNLGYTGCKTFVRSGVDLIIHLQAVHRVSLIEPQTLDTNKTHISMFEVAASNQPKSVIKYVLAKLNGKLEHFLIVVKIIVINEKSTHRCAVIYVGCADANSTSHCKAEDFQAKIDIEIIQEQKKTHVCSTSGSPLHFKKVEDANVIPYFDTSINYIKSRLDHGKGTSFELVATVEISYHGKIDNDISNSDSELLPTTVVQKRSCDSPTTETMRALLRAKFNEFKKLKLPKAAADSDKP